MCNCFSSTVCKHSGVCTGRGGVSGVNPPPPLTTENNENVAFWNDPPFFICRDCRNIVINYHVFVCYPTSLCYIILKNFLCDAIIPVVKLFWCVALDVDDCKKSETFVFWDEPIFLRAELAGIAVMFFFCSVQLSNLISKNFYYDTMQHYRYSNFSDAFCLNCNFVIDAAVKQLVSGSTLKYEVSAVTMAAHKIFFLNQIFTVIVSLISL